MTTLESPRRKPIYLDFLVFIYLEFSHDLTLALNDVAL